MWEQGTQTPPVQTLQGHAERHQALEAKARSFAIVLERNNMSDSYEAHFPQVSLSVAGRSVESRAVIVVMDRTSCTSPMPEHRSRHPPLSLRAGLPTQVTTLLSY